MGQTVCPNKGAIVKCQFPSFWHHRIKYIWKLVSKTCSGIPWPHKLTEVWTFLVRLRKHFDHILRRGVKKNIICFCMTCLQPEIVCDGENINPSLACTLTFFRREHSKMIFSHFFLTELNYIANIKLEFIVRQATIDRIKTKPCT